jgi:AbrB family looped-hinge helix DNA binding protein
MIHGRERLAEEGTVLEFAAYVRREGRITLPKEVRDALSIDEGCLVRVKVEKVRSQR